MTHKFLFLVAATVVLSGCSKLTKENYDKLEMGMTHSEVEDVIGHADKCAKTMGTESCRWGEENDRYIKIMFMDNKAVTFSYDNL